LIVSVPSAALIRFIQTAMPAGEQSHLNSRSRPGN
jgi:hypothetical protein